MNINHQHNASPIYLQLVDGFRKRICSGSLAPGQRVPPVRVLAKELGVNPNTMQRALSSLEKMGLMRTDRTSGRYVTTDINAIIQSRIGMMQELCGSFLYEMLDIGCTKDEVIRIIEVNSSVFGKQNH